MDFIDKKAKEKLKKKMHGGVFMAPVSEAGEEVVPHNSSMWRLKLIAFVESSFVWNSIMLLIVFDIGIFLLEVSTDLMENVSKPHCY